MFRPRVSICVLLVIALFTTGCSKNSTPKATTSEQPSVVLGDTYVIPLSDQTFYCMRANDNYYKFIYTGCFAELLTADDPSLFPDIEDGQFVHVTADLEETKSDFGFYPVITTVSTKITAITESEPVDFEKIAKALDLPSADSEEINKDMNLFQYTHKGKLYLILVYKGQVTAYSEDGLLIDYELKD